MPRQIRIEYGGAIYHVIARGDRQEAIVLDDGDRRTFFRTLGEASERAGFRVHAFVLMKNHYHLLLETPEANLSAGMGWMQNAYTRRLNTRHQLWGHVFGGRYKSIAVEPGNYFWVLLDYIHLNPVRAGMVKQGEGVEGYPWSSLKYYLGLPKSRPKWMETAMGYSVCGCKDTARGRDEFLKLLEARVDWKHFTKAGAAYSEGEGRAELSMQTNLRRGWALGSQQFREKLMKLLPKKAGGREYLKADGYHGEAVEEHGLQRAKDLIKAGLKYYQTTILELRHARKSDPRKALLAEIIQAETCVRLDWISAELRMGTRAGCCRLIRRVREAGDTQMRKQREAIHKISIIND
jgi:REP element-mobilizing transposase RayT